MHADLFFKAIRAENEELVEYLIEKDVNIIQINNSGCTVFHVATINTSPNIIRCLALKIQR